MKWQCSTKAFRDVWIKNLTSDCNLQITDGTIPGLILRYSTNTHKISFYLAYRSKVTKKRRVMLVGKYEDFKLSEIKERAHDLRKMIFLGQDPMEEQAKEIKQKLQEQEEQKPVDEVFAEYHEKYSKVYKKPSTQRSDINEYNYYIKKRFGARPIRSIEEKDIADAYTDWAKATSFSTANKIMSLFSSMWEWAVTYKYVPRGSNPCQYIKKGSNEKFKPTVLDIDGYQRLFKSLDKGMRETRMHKRFFRALKLLALTGCRCSEITDLELDEVDLEKKMIRLNDSKTGARNVKLSDAAVTELSKAVAEAQKMKSTRFVFPGVLDKNKPISNVTKPFDWALKDAGLPHMRIHDLRHSFITMGATMGENMNALKDAAGHTKITTTEMYTHVGDACTFNAVNHIADAIYK